MVKKTIPINYDKKLFEKLKKLRLTFAKSENVPAFCIFYNTTLKEMSSIKPISMSEMLKIHGVGPVNVEKYGPAFCECIINYKTDTDTEKPKHALDYLKQIKKYTCEQCGKAINHRGNCLSCNYALKHEYTKGIHKAPENMGADELKTRLNDLAEEIKTLIESITDVNCIDKNCVDIVNKIRRRAKTIMYYSTFLMFDKKDIERIEELRKRIMPELVTPKMERGGYSSNKPRTCDTCKREMGDLRKIRYDDLIIKPERYFNYYWLCDNCINEFKLS